MEGVREISISDAMGRKVLLLKPGFPFHPCLTFDTVSTVAFAFFPLLQKVPGEKDTN